MSDQFELIRNKIAEVAAISDAEEIWMSNTIITEDGIHIGVEDGDSTKNDKVMQALDELSEIISDDKELERFAIREMASYNENRDVQKMREEQLGWKPGMTIGTPDVPQEIVDKHVGVTFRCRH